MTKTTFNNHGDKDEEHSCDFCKFARIEYRLVNGTSYEGLSIRELYYDKDDKLVGFGNSPLCPQAATKEEVIASLVDLMKDIDAMLEAAKKPILQESELEEKFK